MRGLAAWGTVELPRLALALSCALTGLLLALIAFVVLDAQTASVAATIATSVAVLVALAVGLVPWFVAREERESRSIVMASRISHDMQTALHAAETIIDGLGYCAETADAPRIKESAKRCLPIEPNTIDESFEKIASLKRKDAVIVCNGAMAVIDQYQALYMIANIDLDEGLAAFRMEVVAEKNGTVPADVDAIATARLGKFMMRIARQAAARAVDTQARVPKAMEVLRRYGALTPAPYQELFESPIPEIAAAVRAGHWPPAR